MKKILVRLINNKEPIAVIDGSLEDLTSREIFSIVDEIESPYECEFLEVSIDTETAILFPGHYQPPEYGEEESTMDYTARLSEGFLTCIDEHFENGEFHPINFSDSVYIAEG